MKKIVILLSILLTLIFTGVLYGINQKTEEVKIVQADQSGTNQPPGQWPDVIPDPMVGFPLH
jgi:uncharacterized protein YxeA